MKIFTLATFLIILVTEVYPKDKFEEANNAFFNRDYQKALTLYNELIQSGRKDTDIYYRRGITYLYLNIFDKALGDFSYVIERDKRNADAFNNRGLCHSYMGNIDMALADFNSAIKIEPKFAQAYINRGSAYVSKGEFDKAVKDFDQAVKLSPDNPEIYLQRAGLYYYLGDFAKAVENYDKTISLGLVNQKIYFNRGNAHFKNGAPSKAIADLTKALEYDPYDTEALMNRAYIYNFLGDDALANADKAKVDSIKFAKFTPVEQLNFTTFKNQGEDFFIDLPDTWRLIEYPENEFGMLNFVITPENINPNDDAMLVGVTVGIMKNMNTQFPVESESDILDFWKGSIDESNRGMKTYDVFWQKHQEWNGHASILNLSVIQVADNYVRFNLYEFAIAWGNNLIFVYFQSPEDDFDYYRQIFDKARNSIRIGNTYKIN